MANELICGAPAGVAFLEAVNPVGVRGGGFYSMCDLFTVPRLEHCHCGLWTSVGLPSLEKLGLIGGIVAFAFTPGTHFPIEGVFGDHEFANLDGVAFILVNGGSRKEGQELEEEAAESERWGVAAGVSTLEAGKNTQQIAAYPTPKDIGMIDRLCRVDFGWIGRLWDPSERGSWVGIERHTQLSGR